MEKIKLSAETFDSVMSMLNSSDQESVIVGLSCIEELDITTGITYLLLLKKLANVSTDAWEEYAPTKAKYLNSLGLSVEYPVTYKKILDIITERKVPIDDLQFFLNKFAIYIKEGLRNDYAIINDIEIKINLKLHVNTETSRQSGPDI